MSSILSHHNEHVHSCSSSADSIDVPMEEPPSDEEYEQQSDDGANEDNADHFPVEKNTAIGQSVLWGTSPWSVSPERRPTKVQLTSYYLCNL